MNNRNEVYNILINVDVIFDVKLAVLLRILPTELHDDVLKQWGDSDSIFDYLDSWGDYQDDFIAEYDKRTVEDIRKADLTSICALIEKYNSIDSANSDLISKEYRLTINTYPYKFSTKEFDSLVVNIGKAIPSVTVDSIPINLSMDDLTPSRLREFNINEWWTMDADQWLYTKMERNLNEGATLCPEVKMITPFVIDYRYKDVDTSRPEKIVNDTELNIKANRIDLFSPLIEVEYIPVNYFRSQKAVNVFELSKNSDS